VVNSQLKHVLHHLIKLNQEHHVFQLAIHPIASNASFHENEPLIFTHEF